MYRVDTVLTVWPYDMKGYSYCNPYVEERARVDGKVYYALYAEVTAEYADGTTNFYNAIIGVSEIKHFVELMKNRVERDFG